MGNAVDEVDLETKVRQQQFDHFLRLALRGKYAGASGGEKRCAKLAKAIVENVPGVDGQAIAGMVDFIRFTQAKPQSAGDLIKGR